MPDNLMRDKAAKRVLRVQVRLLDEVTDVVRIVRCCTLLYDHLRVAYKIDQIRSRPKDQRVVKLLAWILGTAAVEPVNEVRSR